MNRVLIVLAALGITLGALFAFLGFQYIWVTAEVPARQFMAFWFAVIGAGLVFGGAGLLVTLLKEKP